MRYTLSLMGAVQSIERAFTILRALSLGTAGVTDISERTGLPKSTVSRLLSSLEHERAVEQTADGAYRLGEGIVDLGEALRLGQSVSETARPHLLELMEFAGEAVGLDRLEGDSIVTLLQVHDADAAVVVRDWTNEATPVHAVPAGLAIVAHSNRAVQNEFFAREYEPLTDQTMTDHAQFRRRFEDIRANGYAWVFGEFDEELNSVAAPIADASGRTQLAIHIHGPSYRFPNEADIDELGQRVAATAQRIEAQLLRG